ncbi:hypothetical protein M0805_007493 [Coniferiporia weirii]|nr:hypothetical protein M0805_007493 [Coniferiporia weirii]
MPDRGEWQSDFVEYSVGDVVVFEGKTFRNIQSHRSQPDWAPTVTPALWEDTGSGGGYQPSYEQPGQQQPAPPPKWESAPQAPDSGNTTGNVPQAGNPVEEKKWYDFDDKQKKEMMIGGGLAVGLGLLATGFYEHEKHKKQGEEAHAQAHELQTWAVTARQQTERFLQEGPRGPVTWVYSEFLDRPDLRERMVLGSEHHGPWFIARAPHAGGIQPGKCRPGHGATIGYGNEAIQVKQYETLIGDSRGVRWIPMSGRFSRDALGARPVEGGRETDGTPLVIARGHAKEHAGLFGIGSGGQEGTFPGKASPKLDGAHITVGDKEVEVEKYEVLAYV